MRLGRKKAGRQMALSFSALLFLLLASTSLLPSPANAATVTNERPLLFSFDGSNSSIGSFTAPLATAIDESTGDVYVINAAGNAKGPTGYGLGLGELDDERVVCRFDAEGTAQNFTGGSSAGKSCLDGKDTLDGAFGVEGFFASGSFQVDIAIDNSGGAGGPGEGEQGRLYVSEESGPIHTFKPDGSLLRTITSAVAKPCGIAVDTNGNLLVGNGNGEGAARFQVLEFDSAGKLVDEIPMTHSTKRACRLAIDGTGENLYVGLSPELPSGLDKYVEGDYDSSLITGYRFDVTIDQSKEDGHIFDGTDTSFEEHEPCAAFGCFGAKVSGSPFGRDLIGIVRGIAYNPKNDRVYVSDKASRSVKVFGPVTSGATPDVSCQASDSVDLHSFTAHCTINPLGLANSYHFEWKEGTGAGWGEADSSAPLNIEPSDSNPHAVSLGITEYHGKELTSNTNYQVRLVGTNAEAGKNLLSSYSNADTLKTLPPPPPEVKDCSLSAVTTESAHVACTVDPKKEETSWRILKKPLAHATKANCEVLLDEAFEVVAEGTIAAKAPGTEEVKADLTGLLPAQTYCVRVTATDPGGGDREDLSFQTLSIVPSEAATAFAAPRSDTSARINGRVNPNGEADVEYRFEWSEDGANWTQLPVRISNADARRQILVSDELSGLTPETTYHYRLGLLKNEAGQAPSLGGEGTFATRSQAEILDASPASCANEDVRAAQHSAYLGACRGIELVNNPDKGNQAAQATPPVVVGASPMSADGTRVLWYVLGGAPGAPNGTQSSFLAERSEGSGGWKSESISPPAEEQIGKGDFVYNLIGATPDFGAFALEAKLSSGLAEPPPPIALVRVRANGQQDILTESDVVTAYQTYTALDMTDDGEHVLAVNPATGQLEDLAVPSEVLSLMPGGLPSECGLSADGEDFGRAPQFGYHWIATDDASRVYFRAPADGDCGGAHGLYVRNREAGTTTLIASGAEFIRATPDGRQAYFASKSSLDPADTNGNSDIYRWDEEAGKSSCLSCVASGGARLAGDVGSSVMVSDDFSHIYFISGAEVLPGNGEQGRINLYVLSDGQLRFIGVVGPSTQNLTATINKVSQAGLSSDGNVLLLKATAGPGLSTDVMSAQCIRLSDQTLTACEELYRYDDRDKSIECLSCDQDGTTTHSVGSAVASDGVHFKLSGDGATAAFATAEALLPTDVNNDTDIYEWRNGVLHLITDGVTDFQQGLAAPQVAAIDGDGSDILFRLVPPRGRLTGFEHDGVLNLYDARIGGGFLPPSPQAICAEDSCQGPLQAAPATEHPASSSFAGRGNKAPRPSCRGGKVRRRGRCVAKHPSGRKRHHGEKAGKARHGGDR